MSPFLFASMMIVNMLAVAPVIRMDLLVSLPSRLAILKREDQKQGFFLTFNDIMFPDSPAMARLFMLMNLLVCTSIQLTAQIPLVDSLSLLYNRSTLDSTKAALALEISAQTYRTDTELAKKWGEQAIAHARLAGNTLLESSALSTVGVVYYYQGNWEKAMEFYFRSLDISEKHGHHVSASTTLGNIGLMYAERNDHQKALTYLMRSLQAKTDLGDSIGIARSYANIGMVYSNRTMPDSAILFYQKQVELCDQLHEVYGKGIGLNNIGQVYMEKEQYDLALDYFEQALDIKSGLNDKNGMSVTLGNIGELQIKRGNYQQAIGPLKKAVQFAREANSLPKLEVPYTLLTRAYAGIGDYKEAFAFQLLLQEVKDSLNNKENIDRAEELEAKYQHGLQQAELVKQELEIERQNQVKNRILMASILMILLLGGLFYRMRSKQRMKQQEMELRAQVEHAEAEKLRELDAMKSAFLTNISHEFRTPLTLINSPLEQLIKGTLKGDVQAYYQAMLRNGRRLLDLVNQMLDLSKAEDGKMKLLVRPGNISRFVESVGLTFESLAEQKEITYFIQVDESGDEVYFDADKVNKMVTNLLSNAFKYTEEGGQVQLMLTMDGGYARLVVKDTGIGIPEELQPRLFDRFFLTTKSDIQAGSGLGLALTRELVELHHGLIQFHSKPGQGSEFIVQIPLDEEVYTDAEKDLSGSRAEFVIQAPLSNSGHVFESSVYDSITERLSTTSRPKILIVEDHPEVRTYLSDQLRTGFSVLEAVDGLDGLAKAGEFIPDLIISDVMMPGMDGTELCRRIKGNAQTSHIPVILLTAKAERSDKLEGLVKGADDYLVKPFDVEELRVRIDNLIEQRIRLQEHYRQTLHVFHVPNQPVSSMDDAFLDKVRSDIHQYLSDEHFGVSELSQHMGMSRSQLHRKLSALTGYSPNQVIRLMRLEKARHLIMSNWGSVSEVAFACGFSSPAYFSKCYKDQFGHSPGEENRMAATDGAG